MLSVLVVSPNLSVPGGVSAFVECLKRRVTQTSVESFYVGSSGQGGEGMFSVLARLVMAPIALVRRVREKKFDVVHINPSFDGKSLIRDGLLLAALHLAGYRRVLVYFHGWNFILQRRILRHALLRALTARLLNKAALITVLGDDFRDGLVALGVDDRRIAVTRTMFDGEALRAVPAVPLPARRTILFLSRFDREKGGRELLRAFAVVAKSYADLDLIMAGSGADEGVLQALAGELGLQSRVTFAGYVGGTEKAALLRDCTIFALPTYYRSEAMPIAVLEAMGAGKPLLVGSAGALRSIVSEPENGVVLRDITPKTVENGLRRLLENPRFADIGAHNADIAWKKFEARAVTAEIEAIYQKVAAC